MTGQSDEFDGDAAAALLRYIDEARFTFVDLRTPQLTLRVSRAREPRRTGGTGGAAGSPAGVPAPSVGVPAPSVGVLRHLSGSGTPEPVVGARVEAGQVAAEVDAMGVRRPVRIPVSGTLVSVEAGEGEFVEYGQMLYRVEPAAG